MAACSLKIELDNEKRVRTGGETVTGNVVVRCEKNFNCQALQVTTEWSTHGRGNIDQGVADTATVHSGPWLAGQEYRYPFELKSAEWPPTYYGTYLNVSHSVRAHAKLAWAVDPKAQLEFPVAAGSSPIDAQPARPAVQGAGHVLGWLIAFGVIAIFAFFFLWLLPIILLIGGGIWFFKSYLPRQMTGTVVADVQPQRAKPGDVLKCHLEFTPKRSLSVNQIVYKIRCAEICSSGSGSNRKTHTHELFSAEEQLAEAGILPVGQLQSFDFDYSLPSFAAPSMKLSDNELLWTVELRIDIPRWPDWSQTITLIVEPSLDSTGGSGPAAAESPEDQWLNEVFDQLQQSEDRERLEVVLEAIREHQFNVRLDIHGKMDEPPDQFAGRAGSWLEAYDARRDWLVALFIPHGVSPPGDGAAWQGTVNILNFDPEEELLTLRACPSERTA